MVAGVGEVTLPGILEPGGDLLGLGIGGDPVLQRVVDAIFGAVGGDGVLGVPHAHGLVDAADKERARDALVKGDTVDDGTAGTRSVNACPVHLHGGQRFRMWMRVVAVRSGDAIDAQARRSDQDKKQQSLDRHGFLPFVHQT